MNRDKIRILVVEDLPDWRAALVRMYQELLGEECKVWGVGGGKSPVEDAKVALRNGFDLLSLDINLGGDITPDGEGRKPGANGLDLLPVAQHEKVAGVIVVTSARSDPVLHYVIPDGNERRWVRQRLSRIVDAWFPGKKNIIIDKDVDAQTAEQNVETIQGEILTAEELRCLARRADEGGPGLTLQVRGDFDANGDVVHATATISPSHGRPVKFSDDNAAGLLFELARYRKLFPGDCLPREDVLRIVKMKTKKVQAQADAVLMRVDGVRRQLAKEGVDGRIIETRREKGFCLREDVAVQFTGRSPQILHPPYVLEQGDSRSAEGEGNWRVRRKGGTLSRELHGVDAALVELLKTYRDLNRHAPAKEILQQLARPSVNDVAAAREEIALFKRRLRNHHHAILPESLVAEQDGAWFLHEDTELTSISEHSVGMDVRFGEVPDSDDAGIAGRRLARGEGRTPRQRKHHRDDEE